MPLELVEVGTSAVAGIVDNILVELEEQGKITGNYTYAKDAIRIAGAFGGLIVNYAIARPMTTLDKVSGALALSELPLAMHSIRKLVKSTFVKYSPSYGRVYVLEQKGTPIIQTAPTYGSVITSY